MKLRDIITPKPNEEILMIIRESLVPKSGKFFLFSIWFLVPFFFLYPLFRMGFLGEVGFLILVLSGIFLFWCEFRTWSHTLFVITDHRLIDIDQRGIFDRVVTESTFDQMEEVRYIINGIVPTLFRFGTIVVTLRGDAADLQFEHVRNPARVQDLLNDLCKTVGSRE